MPAAAPKIEMRPLAEIKPYERNAKTHPKKQIEQIAASIREFGFNQPIVLDLKGVIIVGHGRLLGAKHLGLEKAPSTFRPRRQRHTASPTTSSTRARGK